MKLVRDNIPGMHERGELGDHPRGSAHRDRQTFRKAAPEEYRLLLRCKLAEEVGEVLSATNHKHLMEEIGDVLDVIEALQIIEGCTGDDVTARYAKRMKFGRLLDGWVLEEKE